MNNGQRKLVEVYEQVADLLPETPRTSWRAWIRLGYIAKKANQRLMINF